MAEERYPLPQMTATGRIPWKKPPRPNPRRIPAETRNPVFPIQPTNATHRRRPTLGASARALRAPPERPGTRHSAAGAGAGHASQDGVRERLREFWGSLLQGFSRPWTINGYNCAAYF
jgi:hypothetical protein